MSIFKSLFRKSSAVASIISYGKVGQPQWSTRNYESFAKEAYAQNVVAFRCINIIAQGIASLKLQASINDKKVDNHPILKLLYSPNKMQSGSEFMQAIVSYYLISGNSYVEAAYPGESRSPRKTPPVELYSLRSDRVTVIAGSQGMPSAYRYTAQGVHKDFPVSISGVSNVLHIKSFNPVNDWYGMANTEAGAYAIDQHNQSSAWNQALLQNSCVPSSALVTKQNLQQEQFDRLKEMVEDRYSGSSNAGKPVVLEGDMDWKTLGLSPKDMDWLEGKREVAREIALAYGVPPMLLGIPGDNTYSNQREARLFLWEQTILPLANKIINEFNNWLSVRYDDNPKLSYDQEKISALGLRRELQRDSLDKCSFMTTNEKRAALGLEPIDGGDIVLVDSNKLPLSFASEAPASEKSYIEALQKVGFSPEEIKQMLNQEAQISKKLNEKNTN